MGSFDVPLDDERTQLDAFVEEYRGALEMTLDGLTEEQARRRLVPSATTIAPSARARTAGSSDSSAIACDAS